MCALILLFRNLQYSARGGEKITKTKLNNTSKQRNNQICDRNSEEWTKSISWTCLPTASVAEGQPECLFQSVCQAARHAVWKHPQSQNLNTFTCKSFVLSQGKGEGKGKEYSLWTMNLLYVPGSEISKSTAMCSLLLWCCQYMSESFQHIFHTSQFFSFPYWNCCLITPQSWLPNRRLLCCIKITFCCSPASRLYMLWFEACCSRNKKRSSLKIKHNNNSIKTEFPQIKLSTWSCTRLSKATAVCKARVP